MSIDRCVFKSRALRWSSIAAIGAGPAGHATAADWLQFGFDPSHSGYNPAESSLAANIDSMQLLFEAPLPAKSEGSAVYAAAVPGEQGARDMVFVETVDGQLVAIDAQTGEQIWTQQPATGPMPSTKSTPAIDPNRQFVYLFGLDGEIHKYAIATGDEITGNGWPQVATLKPDVERGSSALAFATAADGNTYLYATVASASNDEGDYQGHVTSINLATGAQTVFNLLCSDKGEYFAATTPAPCADRQAGIWGRPGVAYDAALDRIFTTTGNGPFGGGFNWGQSVVALSPSLATAEGVPLKAPLDSYTPPEYDLLNASDIDLGQTIPAILPAPAGSKYAHLGVQMGKDGIIRLLNLDDMSGKGGIGNLGGELQQVSGLSFIPYFSSQPAVWVDPSSGMPWLFAINNGAVYAFILAVDAAGNPGLVQVWSRTDYGGSSAVVADGLVVYAEQSLNLVVLDAKTGTQLWSTPTSWVHWASPIIADGKIFLPDGNSTLRAFAIPVGMAKQDTPPPRLPIPPWLPLRLRPAPLPSF